MLEKLLKKPRNLIGTYRRRRDDRENCFQLGIINSSLLAAVSVCKKLKLTSKIELRAIGEHAD